MKSQLFVLSIFFVISGLFFVPSVMGGVVTDGLVHYWTFDSNISNATHTQDAVGDNDGILVNISHGFPQSVTGYIGEGYFFDRTDGTDSDEYIVSSINDTLIIGVNEEFTYDFWFKGNYSPSAYILGYHDTSPFGASATLSIAFDNGTNKTICSIGDSFPTFYDGMNITDDSWHHFAFLRNSTHNQLWIDGVLRNTTTENIGQAIVPKNNAPLSLGSWEGVNAVNGILDEVKFYNESLSPSEILQNYQATSNNLCDNTSPVVTLNYPYDFSLSADSTPDCKFTATDDYTLSMDCTLWMSGTAYGTVTASNNTEATITANASWSSGDHDWYVNCSDGTNEGQSSSKKYGVGTNIIRCSVLIDDNTTYAHTLGWIPDSWTTGSDFASCYEIIGNNIVLDGGWDAGRRTSCTKSGVNCVNIYRASPEVTNFTLKNMRIDGSGANFYAIRFNTNAHKNTIDHVYVREFSNAVRIDSENNTIDDFTGYNNQWDTFKIYGNYNNLSDIRYNCGYTDNLIQIYSSNNIVENSSVNCPSSGDHSYDAFVRISGGSNNVLRYNNISWQTGFYIKSAGNHIYGNRIANCGSYGFWLSVSGNDIYNNFINNTNQITGTASQNWNTTMQVGDRIHTNGTHIGGNYYANPSGSGHSEVCNDTDYNGFCDEVYVLGAGTDYLPLSGGYVNDTEDPVVVLGSPTDGKFYNINEDLDFLFTATDNFASPLNCSVYIDTVYCGSVSATNDTETEIIPSGSLSRGEHVWYMTCEDFHGNIGTIGTWSFETGYTGDIFPMLWILPIMIVLVGLISLGTIAISKILTLKDLFKVFFFIILLIVFTIAIAGML